MAEYIEREALRNSVESINWYSVYKGKLTTGSPNTENALYKASSIYAAIDNAPTADVAPVVRCKDCEHFRLNDENVPYCLNPFGLDDPEPNGFCNYGIGKN